MEYDFFNHDEVEAALLTAALLSFSSDCGLLDLEDFASHAVELYGSLLLALNSHNQL